MNENVLEEVYGLVIIEKSIFQLFNKFKIKDEKEINILELSKSVEFDEYKNTKESLESYIERNYQVRDGNDKSDINKCIESYHFYNFKDGMDERLMDMSDNGASVFQNILSDSDWVCTESIYLVGNDVSNLIYKIDKATSCKKYFEKIYGEDCYDKMFESEIFSKDEYESIDLETVERFSLIDYLFSRNSNGKASGKFKRFKLDFHENCFEFMSLFKNDDDLLMTKSQLDIFSKIFKDVFNIKDFQKFKDNLFFKFLYADLNILLKFEKVEKFVLEDI